MMAISTDAHLSASYGGSSSSAAAASASTSWPPSESESTLILEAARVQDIFGVRFASVGADFHKRYPFSYNAQVVWIRCIQHLLETSSDPTFAKNHTLIALCCLYLNTGVRFGLGSIYDTVEKGSPLFPTEVDCSVYVRRSLKALPISGNLGIYATVLPNDWTQPNLTSEGVEEGIVRTYADIPWRDDAEDQANVWRQGGPEGVKSSLVSRRTLIMRGLDSLDDTLAVPLPLPDKGHIVFGMSITQFVSNETSEVSLLLKIANAYMRYQNKKTMIIPEDR